MTYHRGFQVDKIIEQRSTSLQRRFKVEKIHPRNPPKLRGYDVGATWMFPWGWGMLVGAVCPPC